MKLFIQPPSLGRYKYKVHGGPFLGEHKSNLLGVSINEASIFEEDVKYVAETVSRYGQFSLPNSLLNEFVINKIDRIHVELQSRTDNTCLTYEPSKNEFYKDACSENVFQVFTEFPYEKYKEYEKISRFLSGKNLFLKKLQGLKEPNNSTQKGFSEEKGQRRSDEIKTEVIARHEKNDYPLGLMALNDRLSEYLRRRGLINPRTQTVSDADIFRDPYLNTLVDFKTKGQVADEIRRIEKISEGEQFLNNRNPVSLIDAFKGKQSELISSTLRTLENYMPFFKVF